MELNIYTCDRKYLQMKNGILIILFTASMLATLHVNAGWQQKTSMPSDARVIPNIFVINNLAYIGGGWKAGTIYLNDFWQYDAVNDMWTQKANMPTNVGGGAAFAHSGKGYVACGWVNGLNNGGVNEYDPTLNMWTAKNNFPGAGRYSSCIFVLNNKAYMGLGYSPLRDDLWEYDALTDSWSQKANFIGGLREGTVHFALNGVGYVGLGLNNLSTYAGTNDFYTYDANTNIWLQIGNFPGPVRHSAVSWVANNKAYITTGNTGNANGMTYNDLWEFNPNNLVPWNQLDTIPSVPRQSGGAFAIGNCGYVFGGMLQPGGQVLFNDLWQYCNTTGLEENTVSQNANVTINTTTSQLILKHNIKDVEKLTMAIFNAEGRLIISQKIKNEKTEFDFTGRACGVYIWKFNSAEKIIGMGKVVY